MRGAQGVYIVALDREDACPHILFRNGRTPVGMKVVTVNAAQLDGLPVDEKDPVLHAGSPYADSFIDDLIPADDLHIVEIRTFGAPQVRPFHDKGGTAPAFYGQFLSLEMNESCNPSPVFKGHDAVARFVRCGHDLVIRDMILRAEQQIYISEYPRKAPFVLIFEIATEAPLQYEHVDAVAGGADIVCYVKFADFMGDLRKACKPAVHIQIKTGIYPLEEQICTISPQDLFFRIEKAAEVERGIHRRHARRIEHERIADVGILKMVVAVILHAGRHRDLCLGHILPKAICIQNAFIGAYLPDPVQRTETGAVLPPFAPLLSSLKRDKIRAGRQDADRVPFFIIFRQHINVLLH